MEEGALAVGLEGWSASPQDGVGVVCRAPGVLPTQGPPLHRPLPMGTPQGT